MEMSRKNSLPGRLFIVEGIDGSGKSRQLSLLHRWLEAAGHATVFSEWNSSPLVKKVTRRGKKKKLLTPMTFSLIHATDFADRTEHQIIPPLKAGAGVGLADDLEASFRVFQGRVIEEYERMFEEFGRVVIYASLPIEEQQTRMRKVVASTLAGAKKTRINTWVDLASLARASHE